MVTNYCYQKHMYPIPLNGNYYSYVYKRVIRKYVTVMHYISLPTKHKKAENILLVNVHDLVAMETKTCLFSA